jgi:hypothetical protein
VRRLDAEAEVYVLLVAGVGVEVVGGAAVELVALAEFAADEEAESYGTEAGRDPADGFDEGRVFFFVFGEGHGGDILWAGAENATVGEELHAMDDSAGWVCLACAC